MEKQLPLNFPEPDQEWDELLREDAKIGESFWYCVCGEANKSSAFKCFECGKQRRRI